MTSDILSFFGHDQSISVGQAPARLDVMGGIADYSGSLVLQMPLDLHTTVYAAKRSDLKVNIKSDQSEYLADLSSLIHQRGRIVEHRYFDNLKSPCL